MSLSPGTPICASCQVLMRCKKNGQLVHDDRDALLNTFATYWPGDLWECPGCQAQIVTGFPINGGVNSRNAAMIWPEKYSEAIPFDWNEPQTTCHLCHRRATSKIEDEFYCKEHLPMAEATPEERQKILELAKLQRAHFEGRLPKQDNITEKDFEIESVKAEAYPHGVIFRWQTRGAGFGELTIVQRKGEVVIDTEGMGPHFCGQVIEHFLQNRET